MSVRRVAFVPSAPLLVPALAGGSAALDDELREASRAAVAWAVAGQPGRVIVVAPVPVASVWPSDARWDFHGFGVARGERGDGPELPWQLGIGAWLLDDAEWAGTRGYVGIAPSDQTPIEPLGADREVAVIVVADGSACRTEKAPGYLDERAADFDAGIASRLATGDVAGLADVDGELASELLCSGWSAWRWLAAALGDLEVSTAELVTHVAPYGVAYFVARWSFGEVG